MNGPCHVTAKVASMIMPRRVLATSLFLSLGLVSCGGVETTPPDQERSTVLDAPRPERFGNYPWSRHGGNYM